MVTNTLGSLKVLLAEDNEINRLIATTVLNRWGFITVMAADGAEAVKQLKENHFDLVLMDIQMPNKDGIEATKDIRAMDDAVKKNIPIIALTANAQLNLQDRYADVGMNGYMSKPFREEDLYNLITKVMNQSMNMDEKLYDLSMIEEMAAGDEGFIKVLIETFISSVPPIVESMVAASDAGDWKKAGLEAHSLKSNVSTLQIFSALDDIKLIEQYGKHNMNVEAIPELVTKTSAIVTKAIEQLEKAYS
jgi:CheY-like chemotaxis protein